MKNILVILFLTICFGLNAQTVFTAENSHNNISAARSSANNPWVGAGLKYNLQGDVSDSFIINGRVYYTPISGDRFSIPVSANIENDSFSIGVFPYYRLKDGALTIIAHSGLEYGFDSYRVLAGIEFALYGDDNTPFTLSIAPEYYQSWGVGITGVLPIANGLGLLIEAITGQRESVSVGVIVNSKL